MYSSSNQKNHTHTRKNKMSDKKPSSLTDYFLTKKPSSSGSRPPPPSGFGQSIRPSLHDRHAPEIARLTNLVNYLQQRRSSSTKTQGGGSASGVYVATLADTPFHFSWVLLCRQFRVPTEQEFGSVWACHPQELGKIVLFDGRECTTPRYTRSYGASYQYSGQVQEAHAPSECEKVVELLENINALARDGMQDPSMKYQMCLVNWYEQHHHINPHSDNTRPLVPQSPIFSLSWGQTRTFRLTPATRQSTTTKKKQNNKPLDIDLESGDLLVMGGHCQTTHKHEIRKIPPKNRESSTHPPTSETARINFTFRSVRSSKGQKN